MAAWYAGLTVLALALAYRGRGLGRASGTAIIAGYLAFMTALVITVEQAGVRPAAAVFPAAAVAAAGALLLTWPAQWRTVPARPGGLWQRESVLPGWSIGRLWRLSLILCCAVTAGDAASGPHLILIGLLIAGPCCALLTARWTLTAAASGFAVVLGVVLGVPDQIFAPSPSTRSWPPSQPSERPPPSARQSSSASAHDRHPDWLRLLLTGQAFHRPGVPRRGAEPSHNQLVSPDHSPS